VLQIVIMAGQIWIDVVAPQQIIPLRNQLRIIAMLSIAV
jgi:hypothetical protein